MENKLVEVPCAYHPNRVGIDKCENCGKVICIECRNTIKHQSFNDDDDDGIIYTTTLCPVCYYDHRISAATGLASYIVRGIILIFAMTFIIVGLTITSTFRNIGMIGIFFFIWSIGFIGIPSLMAIAILVSIINSPKEARRLQREKEEFLRSIGQSSSNVDQEPSNRESNVYYCSQCGSKITINDPYCPNCETVNPDYQGR